MTTYRYYQQGFTLLEVMISALVLSVGLLGLAALQGVSLKMSQGSYLRVQAVNLAYEIIDAMRANKPNAASYDGTWAAITGNQTFATAYSSGAAIATADLTAWRNHLAYLPSGTATISVTGGTMVTVTITWDESRLEGTGSSQSFLFTTEL
ncbi:type IV pilus modification protein PilV [Chromatium okenii]|uniref:Type IV pilus modification protein PilV n=1 Tax=Chromatium okenii TaxID=61644 RepID=A0A2S7XVY2_9GAMM|nr:type IV pilus modification protein PilV [Chromatium okenii]PQJ97592.1 type IV pilus modification protein PilV [Chromatium okenii]